MKMHMSLCMPGHHSYLGVILILLQLALVAGPGDMHTSPGPHVAHVYIHVSQTMCPGPQHVHDEAL